MHILVVGWLKGRSVPPAGYGGVERMTATLCREFIRQGHTVTLIAPVGSCIEGATVFETSDFEEAYGYIQTSSADIVLDNSSWSLESPVRLPLNLPFVTITHVNHAIGHTRNVVYLSHSQRYQHGLQVGHDLSAAPVIRVPTDPALKPVGLARQDYLLFLGSVTQHKGVHSAAEVALMLDRELLVAGPAWGEYADRVAAMPNVKMLGEVSDPLRSHLIEQAYAMMCLHNNDGGWYEPGAGVIGEAGAFNTPVAALPNGCLSEIVVNGDNGWIANGVGSVAQLMVEHPTLLDAGRLAREEWSAKHITEQYITLLEHVANGAAWG